MSIAGSVSVWWGINIFADGLERAFFAFEMRAQQEFLAAASARLEQRLQEAYPLLRKKRIPLELQAPAVLSLYIKENGSSRALFAKNEQVVLPIASISKLMTTLVALKRYPAHEQITITQEIVATEGEAGQLRAGDVFEVRDLLYLALMESSNDAAQAVAHIAGVPTFVQLMNEETLSLGLQNTSFINPTGLDEPAVSNLSTAREIAQLARHLFEQYPQVFDILSQTELPLYAKDGTFHHTMHNTNMLLEFKEWPAEIFGGKTGSTRRAGQTLVFLIESPDQKGYIINVILGSGDRFHEMRRLLDWILQSYQWEK